MQSETLPNPHPDSAKGLPPVVPPSGGFIAQLFLVPGLIVAAVIGILLAVNWFIGGASTPQQFLSNLDNTNPEVRWRAADDLAQKLLRDDTLASDPKFALDLSERLHRALAETAPAEQAYADRFRQDSVPENDAERTKLDRNRNYIQYLMACLSACTVPVGEPLLRDLAEKPDVAAEADTQAGRRDDAAWASRRVQAVWALASLGENLKRFDQLSPERREAVLNGLQEEAGAGSSERAQWAQTALALLQGRQSGAPRLLGLDETFDKCARDANPFLRETTALALNFWEGDAKENAHLDAILVRLADDDGSDQPARAHDIRANAALALARRGSDRVRLDLLQGLLDEDRQVQEFHLKPGESPDVARDAAQSTVLGTLKAVAELHRRQPKRDLSSLTPAIDKLTRDPMPSVRSEAEHTLQALAAK